MHYEIKTDIPTGKVRRDISMVPTSIIDPNLLAVFNTPNIINSTVYINHDSSRGKTEVWHNSGDGTWDCVTVSE